MSMDLVLNKNFYNYVGCIMFGGRFAEAQGAVIGTAYSQGLGYSSTFGVTHPCPLVDTSGNAVSGIYFSYSSSGGPNLAWKHTFFDFNYSADTKVSFVAGSGSTAATIDDTALVIPNSDIVAVIETGKRDTNTSILYTVTFSAQTQQVLREFGIERNISTQSSGNKIILLGRAVFDEDIILDADHSLTLQVRLSLPIPA